MDHPKWIKLSSLTNNSSSGKIVAPVRFQMKKVPCSYKDCNKRRLHFTMPDDYRPTQMVEVDDNHEGDAYCSFTCAIMDGKMSVRYDPKKEEQ